MERTLNKALCHSSEFNLFFKEKTAFHTSTPVIQFSYRFNLKYLSQMFHIRVNTEMFSCFFLFNCTYFCGYWISCNLDKTCTWCNEIFLNLEYKTSLVWFWDFIVIIIWTFEMAVSSHFKNTSPCCLFVRDNLVYYTKTLRIIKVIFVIHKLSSY